MEHAGPVSIETFLAVTEMVASQLRLKDADRWSAHICQLKFTSFVNEFPEVSDGQFLWASEQWLQSTNCREFLRYPSWKELMAPLYRTENGMANRSWGFKEELPPAVRPGRRQLELLPAMKRSIASAPDPANTAAYQPFHVEHTEPPLLTQSERPLRQWTNYLKGLAATDGTTNQQGQPAGNPGEGTGDGQVVHCSVQ